MKQGASARLLRSRTIAVVIWVCFAGAGAFAQQQTGTLTGTAVDDSGGVLPGATASATELATTVVRTAVANEQGVFRMAALPPGRYTVKLELAGFAPVTVTDIALGGNEVRELGRLTMRVGAQTEALTVTAETTPVQVASSARTGTITSDQLTNIQMKGRDIYGLLAILPGVQDTNLNRDFTTWTSMRDVTINGAPVTSKNIVVDGVSVVDEGGTGNAFVNPNIDAVGDVQVIANGFTAENGRNNGGLISMTTKSGTNSFRGSGWYNGRRDRWNANDYFRKAQNLPKPLYRVNISGYSIGGPVIIPKVLDSRSSEKKIFFFGSQEFTDDARPTGVVRSNLPTERERLGDFSETRVTNGTIQPIIDPQTGQQFPGNVIPANRINPIGQKLLALLPKPNNILNPQPGQEWTSNSAFESNPLHSRTNHTLRIDGVWSKSLRGSFKFIRDREDNWSNNQFSPGLGYVNNFVPGWIYSGSVTQVLSSRMVNEINAGFGHNNYGFKGDYDYTAYYRSAMGVDPPRLLPFGPYADPPVIGKQQADQYPYVPILAFSGGNRSGLASYSPGAVNGRVMPAANRNDRWHFQDDLSWTTGRHNLKFGFYSEFTVKTEPQSPNYMGNFEFGHNANNPLSTGNGYANALLGIYTTYTEQDVRVDMDRQHWQTEGYLQDSWKVNPRFTLDYGVRLTHSGPFYEVNNANSAFFPEDWMASQAPRLYVPICTTGVPGNQPCAAQNQRAIDPLNPGVILPFAFQGNLIPGTGSQINGTRTGGIPDKQPGQYYDNPYLVAAPRVGFAWDLSGDGKTALRASTGIFYQYPRGGYSFVGGPPVSYSRVIRWATIDDISRAAAGGVQFVESPITGNVAGGSRPLEKSYNGNVAFQRDIGFKTTVEVAWVGNYTNSAGRTVDDNRIPLYAYGNPNNLLNNAPIGQNFLRTKYPGMSSVNVFVNDLANQSLKYNAVQFNVQRRLSSGLQFGVAYTLAKGEGITGYDPYTDELGGYEAIRARYWGPTDVDRRHNLVLNYSYQLPNMESGPGVVRAILNDWQVSGVTKFLSGTVANPSCSSNNAGVQNTDPSLTGVTARCMVVGDPNTLTPQQIAYNQTVPFADQYHFNIAAFAMASPLSPTVGNFGDMPLGLLRHPSWSNWDVTLARRIPINMGRGAGVRLQFQAYNIFNQTQFTNMDTNFVFTGANNSVLNSANTGKYTAPGGSLGVTPPRQLGITVRLDF
jgi:hypothetical protein